jgi:hypothetical protein
MNFSIRFSEVLILLKNGPHTVHPEELWDNERKPHRKGLPRH